MVVNRTSHCSHNFSCRKSFAILETETGNVFLGQELSIYLATLVEDAGSIEGYRLFVKKVTEFRYYYYYYLLCLALLFHNDLPTIIAPSMLLSSARLL